MKEKRDVPQGFQVIFRTWVTLRNGKRVHASAYGLKAFRLTVRK